MGKPLTQRVQANRKDRCIASIMPSGDGPGTPALQLFDSMLWALQGTTRSSWVTVSSPELADVIVLHESDRDERVARWQSSGKRVVIVVSHADLYPLGEQVLVYPFRAAQVRALLNALDGRIAAERGEMASDKELFGVTGEDEADTQRFVKKLRTLQEVQNGAVWLVGKIQTSTVLWLRGDCREYAIDPEPLQALRAGTLDINAIQLQGSTGPGAHCIVRPAVELCWFSGYHSHPVLAPWLSAAATYSVTQWPNFGLIRPPAVQMRVTALLATTSLSLEQIATQARATREEAVRTLNALSACGFLSTAVMASRWHDRIKDTVLQHAGGLKSLVRLMRKRFELEGAG